MIRKKEPILIMILRILLGCVFIFSGLSKAIDPIANAIQFDDYFISFRMPFLQFFSMFAAITLTIVEFVLGMMMLFRVKIKLTSIFYLLFMGFFLLLTAWLALAEHLEVNYGYEFGVVKDCGCFGKAIKMSNLQTFLKNVVIIIPTLIVFAYRKQIPDIRLTELGKILFILLATLIAGFIQFYCYRHLPIIDFSDWKIGTNVADSYIDKQQVTEVTYLYADSTGNSYRFSEDELMQKFNDEPTFFDNLIDQGQEETIIQEMSRAPIQGLTIEDSIYDYSTDLLNVNNNRPLLIIFMHYLDETNTKALESSHFKDVVDYYLAHQDEIDLIALTNSSAEEIANFQKRYNFPFPIYRNDCDPVKGPFIVRDAIHANPGIIYVQNGIVKGKWSAFDFEKIPFLERK